MSKKLVSPLKVYTEASNLFWPLFVAVIATFHQITGTTKEYKRKYEANTRKMWNGSSILCGGTDLSHNPNDTDIFFLSKARGETGMKWSIQVLLRLPGWRLALKFSMDKSGYLCISTECKNLSKMVKQKVFCFGFFPFPKQRTYFILNSEQYSQ